MSGYQLILLLILFVLVAIAFFLHLPPQRSRTQPEPPADHQLARPIFRDDDRYWSGGFLYNNPDDPSLFVPKRYGLGWTVNIGHPRGKLILIGTLLVPVLLAILGALFGGFSGSSGCHTPGCNPFS